MAKEATEPEPLDFAAIIRDLAHGSTNKQASKLLTEAIQAAQATSGKAQIVLTLVISADKDQGLAELAAKCKATLPQPKLPPGTYFTTKTGGLVTEDPRQLTLGAKVLAMPGIKRDPNGGEPS